MHRPSPLLGPAFAGFLFVLLPLPGCAMAQGPGGDQPGAAGGVTTSKQQGPGTPAQSQDPSHNKLRAKAFAAERQGRFAEAAEAFDELHRAEPDRTEWALAAGRCLGQSSRFSRALELLEAAHERWPTDLDITAMLARTLILQTEREQPPYPEVLWAEAEALAEQVLRIDPDHEDSRLLLAQCHYLNGRWDEAVATAQEAARRHPNKPGAHILIGRIAMQRFAQLLQVFANEQPTGSDEANQVAAIHRERSLARDSFATAAKIDPTRAHPHAALSRLAEIDGKIDAARRHLLDALVIDPDTNADHDRLTEGLDWRAKQTFYADLRQRFESTTKLAEQPRGRKLATFWFHEGRALLDGHEFAAARRAFGEVLAGNPDADSAEYYAFLASYYGDDHDDAEHMAAAFARRSAPGFADVLRALPSQQRVQVGAIIKYLGDRAYQQQRVDNSRDLNHVVACLKDSADAWNNHAFLCRETKRFERAYASYQHAIEREPRSAQLLNDAAVVLQYHLPTPENLAKARQMYGRVTELAQATLDDAAASAGQKKMATEARDNARENIVALDKLQKS
ncbi:MAG: tetratricopeptide repeat protein [Planctomycetota bacterium]